MKRLISLLLVPVFVLLMSGVAFAEHYWEFNTSSPQSTGQPRSFKLEFVTLSTEEDDDITVKLFQDGSNTATKVTTKDFGDSGAFDVTVPADGTYEFTMTATSSEDGSTKNSPTRTVTVSGPQVTVINQTTSTGDNTGGATTAAATTDGTGADDGNTQGATTATEDTNGDGVIDDRDLDLVGRVGQDGASTNAEDSAAVLGEEDTNDSSNTWAWIALAVLGTAGVIYYFFYYRRNRQNLS